MSSAFDLEMISKAYACSLLLLGAAVLMLLRGNAGKYLKVDYAVVSYFR
jgi:hypothetical protein